MIRNKSNRRPFYRFLQGIVLIAGKIFYRLSWEGIENIPEKGGVVIASNHASFLDPPFLGAVIPREVGFFAKKELNYIPIVGSIISYSGAIFVDRYGFSLDAFRKMIKRLKKDKAVVIFPEGTRTKTGKFLKPKKGAGMAAVMADVQVVPCWIEGSFSAKPFISKITIHFLPPFNPGEIKAQTKKEHYLLVSERIMYDIIRLREKHVAVK